MNDIREARGIIGKYEGTEVFVIPKNEFDGMNSISRDRIYCLTQSNKYESLLVKNGLVIGHLDPSGGVTEYDNRFAYHRPKKEVPKPKKTEKAKPPVRENKGAGRASHTQIDADTYLKKINEDWDPIGIAIREFNIEVKSIV